MKRNSAWFVVFALLVSVWACNPEKTTLNRLENTWYMTKFIENGVEKDPGEVSMTFGETGSGGTGILTVKYGTDNWANIVDQYMYTYSVSDNGKVLYLQGEEHSDITTLTKKTLVLKGKTENSEATLERK